MKMSDRFTIRPPQTSDRGEWLRLRDALWPEHPPQIHRDEIDEYFANSTMWKFPAQSFVIERSLGKLGGFIDASIRPYAHGCATSPVGYIEGWYVDPDLRRQGYGKKLVALAENWAQQQGCIEMASDCNTPNHLSHQVHESLGYRATIPCITFRKPLTNVAADRRDWIALVMNGLWAQTVVDLVSDPAAGGIDVFLGTTRAEKNDKGHELVALDYEAYAEMALKQMRDLATGARAKWPIVRLAILHRIGRVELAVPSVIIAVSCPHRADSFEACRWLIDSLKKDVAIWKKEIWNDGSGSWVHG
jgi:molybdopterin synthase catalytic subunit